MKEIGPKRRKQLDDVDAMPRALRNCVHEFGYPIVDACVRYGVRDPARIRDLVREIWAGARQAGQTSHARNVLDWLLSRAETWPSAAGLHRILAANSLVIVSAEPSRTMVQASMDAVTYRDGILSKEEKHRRRLRAALRAEMAENLLP